MDTETFLLMAKQLGFSTTELNDVSIGLVQDYLVEWLKIHGDKSVTTVKKATQSDFDNF